MFSNVCSYFYPYYHYCWPDLQPNKARFVLSANEQALVQILKPLSAHLVKDSDPPPTHPFSR